jgi:hypothetical protein
MVCNVWVIKTKNSERVDWGTWGEKDANTKFPFKYSRERDDAQIFIVRSALQTHCPRRRASSIHWIGNSVGPRAFLDAVMKRKTTVPSA